MAGSLYFLLLCLQIVSSVLTNANTAGNVHHHHHHSSKTTEKSSSLEQESTNSTSGTLPIGDPTVDPSHVRNTAKPTPFGFGSKVTGGGNAPPQTPKDAAELEAWLTDKVPRVILISKTYDFSSTNTTANGCKPWKSCPNGLQVQKAMDYKEWCSKEENLASDVTVSLVHSPLNPILVGSRKTLRGVGKSAVIKGKGLSLHLVDNIIIQNIQIDWLNPHLVWGGDGIMMDGAKNVWIDHCTFSNIGRQMIVSGGRSQIEGNTGITISNNLFSGTTKWSTRCQDRHYWVALFTGPGDEITMARNCIDSTSGRSPKTGGSGNPKVELHYYNNLHTNTLGETFEIGKGSNVLAEGNLFKNVKIQHPGDVVTHDGGNSYVPFRPEEASRCTSSLGRPCVANQMVESSTYKFDLNLQAVNSFKQYPDVTKARVLPASSLMHGVPGHCGVGFI
ncbi:hypothetical protein PCASD_07313 [Puccinia coronata f. sp. avenae]|uniref:pectin lyase n=1 Tax=Puccinia coronata f. sp. avenae TaxID=200324 RepID=A0A2N5URH4_9BASI|nr:hypothetical protein PCASD_07313 [Puccinia coronata f. sp. avenae]